MMLYILLYNPKYLCYNCVMFTMEGEKRFLWAPGRIWTEKEYIMEKK